MAGLINSKLILVLIWGLVSGQRDDNDGPGTAEEWPTGNWENNAGSGQRLVCSNQQPQSSSDASICHNLLTGLSEFLGLNRNTTNTPSTRAFQQTTTTMTPSTVGPEENESSAGTSGTNGNVTGTNGFQGMPVQERDGGDQWGQMCCALISIDQLKQRCCEQLKSLCERVLGQCPLESINGPVGAGQTVGCTFNLTSGSQDVNQNGFSQMITKAWNWLKKVFSSS